MARIDATDVTLLGPDGAEYEVLSHDGVRWSSGEQGWSVYEWRASLGPSAMQLKPFDQLELRVSGAGVSGGELLSVPMTVREMAMDLAPGGMERVNVTLMQSARMVAENRVNAIGERLTELGRAVGSAGEVAANAGASLASLARAARQTANPAEGDVRVDPTGTLYTFGGSRWREVGLVESVSGSPQIAPSEEPEPETPSAPATVGRIFERPRRVVRPAE